MHVVCRQIPYWTVGQAITLPVRYSWLSLISGDGVYLYIGHASR